MKNSPTIMECTIRDGSYNVGFKFTERDTTLLTEQLAGLGFEWIEVGHGVGIGAMEAGKGLMPADDFAMIRAAKKGLENCGREKTGKIGAFFIPTVAKMEHLPLAREAGLDFIRIGANADAPELAFPYLAKARDLGLTTCINFMKSYSVKPEVFAQSAKRAVDAGAEIVYCVDSAGSMLPDELARYLDATRAAVQCELGFHGHNNLMMGVANCIVAYQHGARFLDTTLCGLGRSAGNAPTEILVAVLERMGIKSGIDLFELLDTVEAHIWPLVESTRPNDMMAIAAGYSQFHSSFFPPVAAMGRKHNVELKRLVSRVALHDPVNLDKAFLEKTAKELANTAVPEVDDKTELLAFQTPGFSDKRVNNSLDSIRELIDGLVVSSAKRVGSAPVLHLVPTAEETEGFVVSEFASADSQMTVGRITYGSLDILKKVIALAKADISLLMISHSDGWATQAATVAAEIGGQEKVFPIRDSELWKTVVLEALDRAAMIGLKQSLLLYGMDPIVREMANASLSFPSTFVMSPSAKTNPPRSKSKIAYLNDWKDWSDLRLQFDAILCGTVSNESEASMLIRALSDQGLLITTSPITAGLLSRTLGDRLVKINLSSAYAGIIRRYTSLARSFGIRYQAVAPLEG